MGYNLHEEENSLKIKYKVLAKPNTHKITSYLGKLQAKGATFLPHFLLVLRTRLLCAI